MKCNQCNSPMVKGYFPLYCQPLSWLPEEVKLPVLKAPKNKDQLILSEKPAFLPVKAIAYNCPKCKTVTVTY